MLATGKAWQIASSLILHLELRNVSLSDKGQAHSLSAQGPDNSISDLRKTIYGVFSLFLII